MSDPEYDEFNDMEDSDEDGIGNGTDGRVVTEVSLTLSVRISRNLTPSLNSCAVST